MARRNSDKPSQPASEFWGTESWPFAPPVPEAVEGGESVWDAWHEAARQLDEAFAPTQPSEVMPLAPAAGPPAQVHAAQHPLSADALMVIARRNNRTCPRPQLWQRLYEELQGDRHEDLAPPPIQPWIWSKLSALQKRVRFREHVEWAERKGKLNVVAEFIDAMHESDWMHMGE